MNKMFKVITRNIYDHTNLNMAKYIRFIHRDEEIFLVFRDRLHSEMFNNRREHLISAGYIYQYNDIIKCSGNSESLNIGPAADDTELFNQYLLENPDFRNQ